MLIRGGSKVGGDEVLIRGGNGVRGDEVAPLLFLFLHLDAAVS